MVPGLFRPKFDRKQLKTAQEQPVPFAALQQIEIQPHYVALWPPADWQTDVGEVADDLPSATRLIILWMEHAWRRR